MTKSALRRTMAAVLAATCMSIGSLPARAEGSPDASDAARAQADVRFKEGLRLYNDGHYQDAWLQFSQALAIYPRGSLLRSLGLCELKLNKPIDALRHFRAALASTDLKPSQIAVTNEDIAEANAVTGHIAVHTNAGATVSVDGQDLGPLQPKDPVDVLPGHHLVEAHLGTRVAKGEVDAGAGAVVDIDVHVDDSAPPPPASAPTGVGTQPVARGLVTPPAPQPQPQGERSPTFFTTRNTVVVALGAVAIAGIVTGVVYKVAADNDASQEQTLQAQSGSCQGSPSPRCVALSQAGSARASDTNAETGFFIGGGALAATSVALLLLWHDTPSKPSPSASSDSASIHFMPALGPTTAGLRLTGTF